MRTSDKFKRFLFENSQFADITYNIIKVFVSIVALSAILLPLCLIVLELIRIEMDVQKCVENGGDEKKCFQDYDVD